MIHFEDGFHSDAPIKRMTDTYFVDLKGNYLSVPEKKTIEVNSIDLPKFNFQGIILSIIL